MRSYFLVILCCLSLGFVHGQEKKISIQKPFGWYEDTLANLSRIIMLGKTDSIKYDANNQFKEIFKEALLKEGAFKYPFDSLITIANLRAPDGKFRLFTWHIRKKDITFEYFSYILYYNKAKKKYYLTELTDRSPGISRPQFAKKLNKDSWYGCHYYTIVGKKRKNNFYVLLGWDGNYYNMQRKIVEIVKFDSKGNPKFGGAKIRMSKGSRERLFLQYSSLASAMLRYENRQKWIVFDHLIPPHPSMAGMYDKYIPSGMFNALVYEKNRWYFKFDVEANDYSNKGKRKSNKQLRKEEKKRFKDQN